MLNLTLFVISPKATTVCALEMAPRRIKQKDIELKPEAQTLTQTTEAQRDDSGKLVPTTVSVKVRTTKDFPKKAAKIAITLVVTTQDGSLKKILKTVLKLKKRGQQVCY